MFLAVCLATSLILVIALWLCWSRIRAGRRRARPGGPVDFGPIPGTRMFDAELTAVEPSDQRKAVDAADS